MIVPVAVQNVHVVQELDSMKLLNHVYNYRGSLWESYAYVPNRLIKEPYYWRLYSSNTRKVDG